MADGKVVVRGVDMKRPPPCERCGRSGVRLKLGSGLEECLECCHGKSVTSLLFPALYSCKDEEREAASPASSTSAGEEVDVPLPFDVTRKQLRNKHIITKTFYTAHSKGRRTLIKEQAQQTRRDQESRVKASLSSDGPGKVEAPDNSMLSHKQPDQRRLQCGDVVSLTSSGTCYYAQISSLAQDGAASLTWLLPVSSQSLDKTFEMCNFTAGPVENDIRNLSSFTYVCHPPRLISEKPSSPIKQETQ